jgi:hypothetical protein
MLTLAEVYDLMATMFLLLFMLVIVIPIIKWHKNPSVKKVDLADIIVDNGKVSLFKIGQVIALIISSWAFVTLVQQKSLTWEFFATYMAVWTGANVAKIALKKPEAPTVEETK